MTLVRQWSWEHTWAAFSLLGMFVFNWIITLLLVPNIFAVYSASPVKDLAVLALFGLGWGVGAVLFGLGMERLGMALGQLNATIDVPEDIPYLGVRAGSFDLQRFLYWNVCKLYYRPDWTLDNSNSCG